MLKASGKSVRSSSIFTADVEKGLAFSFFFFPWFTNELVNHYLFKLLVLVISTCHSIQCLVNILTIHPICSLASQEVQPLVSNSVEAISEGKSNPHFNMNIHPHFLSYRGSTREHPIENTVTFLSALELQCEQPLQRD